MCLKQSRLGITGESGGDPNHHAILIRSETLYIHQDVLRNFRRFSKRRAEHGNTETYSNGMTDGNPSIQYNLFFQPNKSGLTKRISKLFRDGAARGHMEVLVFSGLLKWIRADMVGNSVSSTT